MVGTEDMGQELVFKAYGKINLGLDVVRRLENGYHAVCETGGYRHNKADFGG